MLGGTTPPTTSGHPRHEAADLVALFLVAWKDAMTSYEALVASGIPDDDTVLAKDHGYARLLKAGQNICWIGGEAAVRDAVGFITRHVPGGAVEHFDRLWCGLLPRTRA